MRSYVIRLFILSGLCFYSLASAAATISDDRVFAFAEAKYSSIFSGTRMAGQYQQYNYRYYAGSGNYLAVDSSGVIFLMGPSTGNEITYVGPVDAFSSDITAWEATVSSGINPNYVGSFTGYTYPSTMNFSIDNAGGLIGSWKMSSFGTTSFTGFLQGETIYAYSLSGNGTTSVFGTILSSTSSAIVVNIQGTRFTLNRK